MRAQRESVSGFTLVNASIKTQLRKWAAFYSLAAIDLAYDTRDVSSSSVPRVLHCLAVGSV